MATVTLKHLSKTYGHDVLAVDDLSLSVDDGEFVCLLGPSGCGKSTTLRMIAGLESITKGDLYIDETRVNDLGPRDRDIAMAFENYALYPHMTVGGNIAFPLRIRKVDESVVTEKVIEVAELMGIRSILDEDVKDLSGGAQQRTGVARALVRNPRLLLLDEPISHLEEELKARMREDLRRLQREIGVTTIYVTHDQIEAMVMADRIAIMNFGVLQQFGTPQEVYETPSNAFVGGFIGEPPMNFLRCNVDSTAVSFEGIDLAASESTLRQLQDRGVSEALLGVRDTQIGAFAHATENAIRAEVVFVEPRNEEQIINVRLGSADLLVSTGIDVKVKAGEAIWLRVDWSRVNLFDPQSELNLRLEIA